MIYKTINDWFEERITELNNSLTANEKLKPVTGTIEMDLLPLNLKDNTYFVKIEDIIYNDDESGEITAAVSVQFHFRLYKRTADNYKKNIDEKLYALTSLLAGSETAGLEHTANSLTLANLHNLSINDLDKAYKGGEYIFPKLKFHLQVFTGSN